MPSSAGQAAPALLGLGKKNGLTQTELQGADWEGVKRGGEPSPQAFRFSSACLSLGPRRCLRTWHHSLAAQYTVQRLLPKSKTKAVKRGRGEGVPAHPSQNAGPAASLQGGGCFLVCWCEGARGQEESACLQLSSGQARHPAGEGSRWKR